ncbi:MAG: MgtC/SapB family protein [Clostridia bacterium]|nr:MgtC/SapB family protein [Clostridia bacterium]
MNNINNIIEILKGLNAWSVLFRLVMSLILGGLVGFERGHHGRAAGLRTHILVCLGATMAALVGLYSTQILGFNSDPLRVGAQVVSGIGFLGVGTIMIKDHSRVTGLTTAAGLWTTACIGLSIGMGFYLAALIAFAIVIITFSILVFLDKSTRIKNTYMCYVEISDISNIKTFYDEIKGLVSKVEVIPAKSGINTHIGLELITENESQYKTLMNKTQVSDDVVIALPINQ